MLLSVIIPVYNLAEYIVRTLDSVSAAADILRSNFVHLGLQPAPEIEVIAVDDGSTDGTGAILDEYRERAKTGAEDEGSSRLLTIRVVHQTNGGVSVARNVALDAARGDWVMMLDGDDTWAPDLLVRLFTAIREHPECSAVAFGMERLTENGTHINFLGGEASAAVMSGDAILADGLGQYSKFIWSSCDKIYRRSVIERFHLRYVPGVKRAEDSLFTQVFLAYAREVVLLPELSGYKYLMRFGSAVHERQSALPKDPFFAFRELYRHWRKLRTPGLLRRLMLVAAGLPLLGKDPTYLPEVRPAAIELLLDSRYFNRGVIAFLLAHGSVKAKAFALTYLALPKMFRRQLLKRL